VVIVNIHILPFLLARVWKIVWSEKRLLYKVVNIFAFNKKLVKQLLGMVLIVFFISVLVIIMGMEKIYSRIWISIL